MAENEKKKPPEEPGKEKKKSEVSPEVGAYPEMEVSLEKTKRDIEDQATLGKESTKTEIRIDAGEEKTPVEELEKVEKKGSFLGNLIDKIKSATTREPAGEKEVKPLSSTLARYVGIWVAPPEMNPLQTILFYLSRILILIGTVGLYVILIKSSLRSYQGGGEINWILMGATGGAVLLSLLVLLFRWPLVLFLGFPLVAVSGLLFYHAFFYPTTDSAFLSMMGKSPAYFYNQWWIGLLFFELILILFLYPRFFPLKIILAFLALYGLSGFVFNKMEGIALESAWEGSRFFQMLPLIYLQPYYVAIHFLLPLIFLVSLASLFFKTSKGYLGWIGLNLIVILLSGALGLTLMHQNRIPTVLTLFLEEPLKVGSIETEYRRVLLGLKTVNFEALKGKDNTERYRFSLKPRSPIKVKDSKKKAESRAGKTEFFLSAFDLSGTPVLFLTKSDLVFTANGEPVSNWNIKPIKPSERKDRKGKIQRSPHYSISVALPKPRPTFDIFLPEKEATFSSGDSLKFALKKESPPVKEFEVKVDGQSEIKQKVPPTQRSFTFRLSRLSAGKHTIEIKLTGTQGNESVKSQKITMLSTPGLTLESPMAGDYFSDSLSVFAQIPSAWRRNLTRVDFYLGEENLGSKVLPPFMMTFDTRDLSPGPHTLKVVVVRKNKEDQSESVEIIKGPYAVLSFVSPTLGEFVSSETKVQVKVDGENPYKSIKLLLGDQKLIEWGNSDEKKDQVYNYQWNTSELKEGSHVLRVKGITEGKVQSSDWMQVFTGRGEIQVTPPVGTKLRKRALQYEKIVFILDASVSQWDGWDGKTKWDWAKRIFSLSRIQEKLRGVEVGIVLFGSKKPYYSKDCKDIDWLVSEEKFNSRKITKMMKKKHPKGVSSLYKAVEESLKKKPQRIIMITDGADSCRKKMPSSLAREIENSKLTVIDVITLGEVNPEDGAQLKRLVQSTSGEVVTVADGKALEQEIAQRLTLYYNVVLNDKVVLSGPIDGRARPLRPGTYTLQMEINPPFKDKKISVKNGLVTELMLNIGKDATEVEEKFRLIQ